MKKATAAASIPVVAILTKGGVLPLKDGKDFGVRYPMNVYAFDGTTILGVANRPADVITLVNANVANQAIGTIAKYEDVPYAFKFTKNGAYNGALPTEIKVDVI